MIPTWTPQQVIGPPPPPVPGDEPVMSPPNTVQRSTYQMSNYGLLQNGKPSGMTTGSGPYWPSPIEVSTDPFWGPLGVKWIVYYSTDHAAGDGGIWLSLTQNVDPKVTGDWKTYDQAVALGVFSSVATKPAGNPIYVHGGVGSGSGTETSQVVKIGNNWVMTYQTYKLANSVNQCTNRVLSTDGLNWTGTVTAPLLVNTIGVVGDSHTGYFRWAPNLLSRSIHPFDWIGYSLCGGTDRGMYAQWGTNDPVNGSWTLIQGISPQYGALGTSGVGPTGGGIANLQIARQGPTMLGNRSSGGSGSDNQYGTISEILLDPSGTAVIAKPIDLITMPLSPEVNIGASIPTVFTRDFERVMIYEGTKDLGSNTHLNSIGVMSSPRRNIQNTWFDPFAISIPSSLTVRETDFRAVSAMPSFISVFNNGSPTVSFDTTVGLNLNHPSAGSVRNYVLYWEEIPSTANFVDIYLTEERSRGSGAYRNMYFGFWLPTLPGTALTGVSAGEGLIAGTGGTNNLGVKGVVANSVQSVVNLSSYPSMGWQNVANTYPFARKCVGMRWYRSLGKAYLLGEGRLAGGVETEEISVPADFQPGGVYYSRVIRPRWGMVTLANTTNNEQLMGARVRWG